MVKGLSKKGQFRIIEALISSIIVIIAFIAAVQLQQLPRIWVMREKSDLEEMGFNILTYLAEKGVLERVIRPDNEDWEKDMCLVLKILLPPMLYFNMSVFEIKVSENGTVFIEPVNDDLITNTPREGSERVPEMVSVTYVYTTKTGRIYLIVLSLTRSKGG